MLVIPTLETETGRSGFQIRLGHVEEPDFQTAIAVAILN